MKKIFKSKRKRIILNKKILKLLLISFLCAYVFSKSSFFKNDKVIELLKNTSVNSLTLKNFKLTGEHLINISLNTFDDIKFTKEVFKSDIETNKNEKPRIYIYNTHQTEEYRVLENYNLTPTVLTASMILKDKLKEYGIYSIVETRNFEKEMKNNGYNYNQAYRLSRSWLESLNNPNLDLYIDLHRDSLSYDYSNIVVDGKDYAKIMFVVGTDHNYEGNMSVVNSLVKNIENINKSISRGIFTRKSIYNQDYNSNCILIELGGPESTYESISNSLDVFALAVKEYLGE